MQKNRASIQDERSTDRAGTSSCGKSNSFLGVHLACHLVTKRTTVRRYTIVLLSPAFGSLRPSGKQ